MIEIKYVDYAYIEGLNFDFDATESTNSMSFDGECLWIKAVTLESPDFCATIAFTPTIEFIQELKALVMVMENTCEEKNND